ncbi:MAG: hypothetical protein QXO60_02475 [Candidatus Micrarchaeia archaeon]
MEFEFNHIYYKILLSVFIFLFSISLNFASISSDVGVNVTIGQAPVLQINNFTVVPDEITIGNSANFTIVVSNIGNSDGNASSFIQIYNGYNVIDSFSSGISVIPFSSTPTNVSVLHSMNYPVGNYIALGYIKYNNKTIGPVYYNFSINRGQPPSVYLVSPLNNSITSLNNDTLEFVFYVDDVDSSQFTCSLYLDNQKVGENNSVHRLVNTSLKSNVSFSNGIHTWFVRCTDNGDNSADSYTWNLHTGSFCQILNISNLYYVINENLSSDETCFTITASNVTLDCQGYSIFFNSGSAIIIQGQNATIKNCSFLQNNNLSATAIKVENSGINSNIIDNIINIKGNESRGLILLAGNTNITNNFIGMSGDDSFALYLQNTSGDIIRNNSFILTSAKSKFIYADIKSVHNSISENIYVPPSELEGFLIQFYVNQSELNITIPSAGRTPSLGLYIPENSTQELVEVNLTTMFIDSLKVPIDIASKEGYLKMKINISTSKLIQANTSNPIIFTINTSSMNLNSVEESRLGLYIYNESSSNWNALATECNLTSHICKGYLTQFSTYGWIIYIPVTVIAEKSEEVKQVSLSGTLSCTKELAQISTEPNASVEVRFLEQPYANSLIKAGKADENGSFVFIADLPGRYQISARKTGFKDNSLILTAADDCVPRITFVRKWLECSTLSCFMNIPVLTTQMKDVVVDLSDVLSIMTGSLSIRDKYGSLVNFYSFVGKELRFPLITDSFTINSQSNVNMEQINDLKNGKVTVVFKGSNTARVSGFVLNLGDFGNNYINNVTYVADKEYEIFRYTVDGKTVKIDHQLYLYPNSKFVFSVSQVPLRCTYSYECPSDSICQNGTCVVVPCSCGYILNRTCIPYECCKDSDCPSGKSCIANLCIYTPPTISEEEKRYIADRLNVLIVSIQSAREQGEDTTAASQLLEQARTAYEAGDFEKAKELLAQAQQIFTQTIETQPSIPYLAIMAVIVLLLVLVLVYLLISKISKPKWKPKKKK